MDKEGSEKKDPIQVIGLDDNILNVAIMVLFLLQMLSYSMMDKCTC